LNIFQLPAISTAACYGGAFETRLGEMFKTRLSG
jgi:hypothetical protein